MSNVIFFLDPLNIANIVYVKATTTVNMLRISNITDEWTTLFTEWFKIQYWRFDENGRHKTRDERYKSNAE